MPARTERVIVPAFLLKLLDLGCGGREKILLIL